MRELCFAKKMVRCSISRSRTRIHEALTHRRYHSELLKHTKRIQVIPDFLELAICSGASDGDSRHGRLLAGRWDTHELTPMRTACRPAHDNSVPFGDFILNGEMEIGEGG